MKALKFLWIAAFVGSAATYPALWIVAGTSAEVLIISPHERKIVELNRDPVMISLPSRDSPEYPRKVAELYGSVPSPETVRVVFVPGGRILHPEELPSMALLPVETGKDPNPLQVQTLYFFAKWTSSCSAVGGALLLAIWLLLRSKRAPAPS